MDGSTRRRLLEGVSAASFLAIAIGGTGTVGGQSTADETGPLEVSIAETDSPVAAGDYLRVTTELRNRSDEDVRTDLELFVGVDAESIGRRTLTVPAGETETVRQGFYTYPVPTDDSFPVRVETDYGDDVATVSVRGASPLPESRPDSDPTVTPGTTLFFEAFAIDPDDFQQTIWWVDGEQEGGVVGGPWQATYFAEVGADYFQYEFDDPGTYEVAAAVLPDGGGPGDDGADESYVATWTVDVDPAGNREPTIDDRSPDVEALELARGESYEVELTATDPDGDLERVVWWLTQADQIVEITDLEGATDTARLSTDAFCHTCSILPWVIASDGTLAVAPDWQLFEADDPGADGECSVTIRSTNAPVDAGADLAVTAEVQNSGNRPVTREVDYVVGHDPETVDSQTVSLEAGESRRLTLSYETYPVAHDQQFPIRVDCGDDEDEVTVLVEA
ncbi:hypothetical protein [Natrarchaeobaculum aegyptiacum]|uniref:CARDB domain-containing protein n=1 Tax=Natrarchaeobaculum aegyptiacum TaxID=745377 RepID=A0A2Z2HSA8_9EURY|nr:hypothetical protein [Natrarchaeobaculum aegyptiacum]ARS90019.1 hypothetical protein B1756_09955 [Natrarchaeobaculum aegyptiacum]